MAKKKKEKDFIDPNNHWYHYCSRRTYIIAHKVCLEMKDNGYGRTRCKKCEWRDK